MTISFSPSESTDFSQLSLVLQSKDTHKIGEFLDRCVSQLTVDEEVYRNSSFDRISDCALHMPRTGGKLDKSHNAAHVLAKKLTSGLGDHEDPKIRTWGLIIYTQLIAKLSKVVRERKRREEAEHLRSKNEVRTMCLMRNKVGNVSQEVLHPVPMPVDEAPIEELRPIFTALSQGGAQVPADCDFVEFKRGVIFADGRIDLCKQVVGPTHIDLLMESIKNSNRLSHFLLGNNVTGDKGAEAIAKFIVEKHRPVIETWYLAGNEFDEQGISYIAESLKKDTDARSLWLKRNPVHEKGAQDLADMLRVNTTLKFLDLVNTGILDAGAIALFDTLRETPASGLRSLYICANGLTINCVDAICAYFNALSQTKRKGLTRIWIGMNRLEDDGAIALLNAVKNYAYLRTLSLNSNRLGPRVAETACIALQSHPGLRVLDLGMYKATVDMGEYPNCLGDEGALHIATLLRKNKTLQILDVFENEISDAAMSLLTDALAENASVLSFGFGQAGKHYNKDTLCRASEYMMRNLRANAIHASGPELKQFLKHVTHGSRIFHIDSIYRNRALKGK